MMYSSADEATFYHKHEVFTTVVLTVQDAFGPSKLPFLQEFPDEISVPALCKSQYQLKIGRRLIEVVE